MWDLIVSVPDHCLSFYFESVHGPFIRILIPQKIIRLSKFYVTCILVKKRSAACEIS